MRENADIRMTQRDSSTAPDATARLMLVLLGLGWGLSWPAMRIALLEVTPFSMRVATMLIGGVVLGERITKVRAVALALCIVGMLVLVYPLLGNGVPLGILLALGSAVCWAA